MIKKFKFDQKLARDLYDAGQNDTQIGATLSVSPRTISRWRRAECLPPNTKAQIDKLKARELLESGYTIRHVAEYFGVSTHAIHNLIVRENIELPYAHGEKTPDTDRLQELYNAGHSDAAIARLCNVPSYTVSAWRHQENLPAHNRLNQAEYEKMLTFYHDGLSDAQIAAQIGCSAQSVFRFRKEHNLPAHKQTKRVYSGGDALPTWNEDALLLYQQGLSDRKIAEELGLAHSTVGQWRRAQGLPAIGRSGHPQRDLPD